MSYLAACECVRVRDIKVVYPIVGEERANISCIGERMMCDWVQNISYFIINFSCDC